MILLMAWGAGSSYDHGVLCDAIESESFTIVEIDKATATFKPFSVGNGQVVEGIAPIWVDWNGNGQKEIVVTLGDFDNGAQIVASLSGYTSHVIGSRNLEMGAAADFDGDGIVEVLLPSKDRMHPGAIQRVQVGAIVDWQLPLSSQLSSNLSVV